jgi:peptidoglycan-associated lipoprotein
MRALLPATLLLSILLTACASTRDISAARQVAQNSVLKVHPGLLGQPVPTELQEPAAIKPIPAAAAPEASAAPVDLLAQRVIYFDYNSTDLRAEFDPALQAHGRHLAANPNTQVRIEGNADERGSPDYNKQLGLKRAEVVRQALIGHGAADKQMTVKSHGASQPKKQGHDEESWAENRRVEVVYEKE